MARDLGQFVNEARRAVEEFKEDLILQEEDGRKPEESGDSSAKRPPRSSRASGTPSNAAEDRIAPVETKCNSRGPRRSRGDPAKRIEIQTQAIWLELSERAR
jgi:Sec-independent protein translocase protein TatA